MKKNYKQETKAMRHLRIGVQLVGMTTFALYTAILMVGFQENIGTENVVVEYIEVK